MAETIWNESLEVSHQKGDRKMASKKKKKIKKYRAGGAISYSGTSKTPQDKSKFPGMG